MQASRRGWLQPVQALPTSGARAVEPFVLGADLYLAVPQLARDIPGEPAYMNGGDSTAPTLLWRWNAGRFEACGELPCGGGEDAEFFRIGERAFLAIASLRSGRGPYALNTDSLILEHRDGAWVPWQRLRTFAAKQWRHLCIDGQHLLALAQGIRMDGAQAEQGGESLILRWDGERFAPLQTVRSGWGYNWTHFQLGGTHWLGYADHVEPTTLLRWTGARFEPAQDLEPSGGRALCAFEAAGRHWLAVARLTGESWLWRFEGGRFERHQLLCGPGAREFCWIGDADGAAGYLVQVSFITGARESPQTLQQSRLYRFRDGSMDLVDEFGTSGGTDAAVFERDGARYLAVSNSLSEGVRFRTDSMVYRLDLPREP